MFKQQLPTVIMSASVSTLPDEVNMSQSFALKVSLEHVALPFKKVLGSYKGVTEASVVIPLSPWSPELPIILQLARDFHQESVLYLDETRRASLLFGNGQSIPIGHFHTVSKAVAMASDAYTYDPATKLFWLAD